ncbi:transposase [Candidatus Poriferisocius sp.]|uniref:transposase n=1 Tax=Candidatus Poriferisocius sp. TaxID=3101276 RepID=UPI003B5A2FB8
MGTPDAPGPWSSTAAPRDRQGLRPPRAMSGASRSTSSSPTDPPSYRAAIAAHLGHARHVLDRFHAIKWSSTGLTEVCRDVQLYRPEGPDPSSTRRCSLLALPCSDGPKASPTRTAPGQRVQSWCSWSSGRQVKWMGDSMSPTIVMISLSRPSQRQGLSIPDASTSCGFGVGRTPGVLPWLMTGAV